MKKLLFTGNTIEYFNAEDENAGYKLACSLRLKTKRTIDTHQPIVILCIGTDRATGDCLGPLVGEALASYSSIYVYGTLAHPVHALNLAATLAHIYARHTNPFIIAIDASLGSSKHIGYVTLSSSPIEPGKGVDKKLPAIGDLSITGIVNISGFPGSVLLQSTRLHTVMTLSKCISTGIKHSLCVENSTCTYMLQ